METVSPFKEAMDIIKEAGGETFKLCYQCGLCNTTCPWNIVSILSVRRMVREEPRVAEHLELGDDVDLPTPRVGNEFLDLAHGERVLHGQVFEPGKGDAQPEVVRKVQDECVHAPFRHEVDQTVVVLMAFHEPGAVD